MTKKAIKICSSALLGMLMLWSSVSWADVKEPEAEGIQAGGFVMHPGVDVGIAYDSRGSQGSDDGIADIGAHFTTRLSEETQYSWDNQLRFNWRQTWGLGSSKASGGPEVTVSSVADLFKTSMFRITPNVTYSYLDQPEDDYLRRDFENHHVRGGIGVYIQPSGGAVFSQRIGYQLDGRFYTEHSDVSNMTHRIDSVTRWNFLPQTSMALNIDFRAITYLEDEHGIVGSGAFDTHNTTSLPTRITYSLQGLLLERLSYVLGLGYAYQYAKDGNNEHMFIMNARVRYDFTANSQIYVDYKKDFDNVTYGGYAKIHRVALGFKGVWFDHLYTGIETGFNDFKFKSPDQAAREDYLIPLRAELYYHFFPGLKLGLEYVLRYNISNISDENYVKNFVGLKFGYEY